MKHKRASNMVAAGVTLILTISQLNSYAAEPLCWERRPGRPAPAQFDTFHGETLDFRCTFTGFGELPFAGADDVRLWYQTNGMGAAWWSIPATVSSNVLEAAWPPSADPGAERVAFFFGAPSNAYAAAQVRFRNSPGATPNHLDPPSVLDWQAELAAATNDLFKSFAPTISNTYTKSETDARIAELAPRTSLEPATNYTDAAVSAISNAIPGMVTNEVVTAWSDNWYIAELPEDVDPNRVSLEMTYDQEEIDPGVYGETTWHWEIRFNLEGEDEGDDGHIDEGDRTFDSFQDGSEIVTLDYTFVLRRRPAEIRNALGLARHSDITNTVTKAYVEGLGIESGIQEETDPVWAGDKPNYATKQSVTVVSNIAASADTKANTLISYVNGDDVMDVVTNYDSVVHISSRSLRQRVEDGGTNVWRVVWDEMTRWDWFMYTYMPANYYTKTEIDAALDEKADRAWGFYDSHTGGWSPDGYTQISSPKILIAAGMSYQRHVVTGGAVWVLESNGLATEIGGVASNGFFRISDDDGNSLFEIVKGNKRTIGSTANALTTEVIMGITHMHITYAVESAEHPIIEATANLGTPFVGEDSASSIVNVTWTGSSGAWVAEVWPKTASSSLFVRASHEVGGETYIKNTAPTGLDGGLIYNGVKYRVVPYSSGGKTYLTLEAW